MAYFWSFPVITGRSEKRANLLAGAMLDERVKTVIGCAELDLRAVPLSQIASAFAALPKRPRDAARIRPAVGHSAGLQFTASAA
jgi:hypothetical protein